MLIVHGARSCSFVGGGRELVLLCSILLLFVAVITRDMTGYESSWEHVDDSLG